MNSSAIAPHAAGGVSGQAAAWVAQQVSPNDVVSCDLVTCEALRADGFPVGGLLVLNPKARDLLVSEVVISTAAIRNLFGSHLEFYAPTVMASFGSGKSRIDIRTVAPQGAAVYLAQLRSDLGQRQSAGTALMGSSRVTGSAVARRQMITGQVDSQLLIVLTNLAAMHSLRILAFSDSASGASAGVPFRSVYLADPGRAVARQQLGFLRAQEPPYLASHMGITQFDGHSSLYIEFAAPNPLGLLNTEGP